MNQPLLQADNLCLEFYSKERRNQIFENLSFNILPGELVGLSGPSGIGKTSLIRSIFRLIPKGIGKIKSGSCIFFSSQFGEIDLLQADSTVLQSIRREDLAYIPQEPHASLNPAKTVKAHARNIIEKDGLEFFIEILKSLGFNDPKNTINQYPHQLSGGMAQRIHLALAFGKTPKIILADEPTHALDPETGSIVNQLIRGFCLDKNTSLLMVSHKESEMRDTVDAVYKLGAKGIVKTALETQKKKKELDLDRVDRPIDRAVLIEVNDLSKSFSKSGSLFSKERKTVLNEISFRLIENETLGILGKTGSGKSTLANCLLRLEDIDKGEILFEGKDISRYDQRESLEWRKKIQWIPQDSLNGFHPYKTLKSHILEPLKVHEKLSSSELSQRLEVNMEMVKLDHKILSHMPHQLSAGQRQRANLARGLILKPKCLILDEPVASLDQNVKDEILRELVRIKDQLGLTFFFISHDLDSVKSISDRIMVLKEGKLFEFGKPAENEEKKYISSIKADL